jgi:predicted DNA-binding transcriptional regulator AlpA
MSDSRTNLIDFDSLPDDAYISAANLQRLGITPFSNSTRHRLIKKKKFPGPVDVAPNIKPFRIGDIRDWQQDPSNYKAISHESATKTPRKGA